VAVVGVRREGLLYLTNTLSGVGEVYQTAFYGLPSDVAVVGVWRALSAGEVPPPVGCQIFAPYKVNVIDDGSRLWSTFERNSITTAISMLGESFDTWLPIFNTPQDAFNRAMLENSGTELLFIRTNNAGSISIVNYQYQYGYFIGQIAPVFTYNQITRGYCITYQESDIVGSSLPRPAAVICSGDLIDQYSGTIPILQASEYTIVHELAHLFDYRTNHGISNYIQQATFALRDCDDGIVMGTFLDGWLRGRRGWGTGPAQYLDAGVPAPLITDFQQNPDNSPIETAADSFLNLIFRFHSDKQQLIVNSCNLSPRPQYDAWQGPAFLNRSWSATPHPIFPQNSVGVAGASDNSLPGDVRFRNMYLIISDLLR
jgi:hypothetical protein